MNYTNLTAEEEGALVPEWVYHARDKQWSADNKGDFMEITYGSPPHTLDTIDIYGISPDEVPVIVKALQFFAANGRLPRRLPRRLGAEGEGS